MLRVGTATAVITPPVGMPLIGYLSRDKGATAVHDDLIATAIVLDDGQTQVALVTCDLLFLHPWTVAQIRSRVHAHSSLNAEDIMLCCTHTHSGPQMWATPDSPVMHTAYLNNLVSLIAGAVIQAATHLIPAAMHIGHTEVEIGINRREEDPEGKIILGENPQGPVDSEMIVLRIDDLQGAPLCLLVNYACHAVCLGSHSYIISADWPGVMRRTIQDHFPVPVGFIQGACADINPLHGPQTGFDNAQQLGQQAAQAVIALLDDLVPLDSSQAVPSDQAPAAFLAAARRQLHLPLLAFERDQKRAQAALSEAFDRPWPQAYALLLARFPWRADLSWLNGQWHATAEVQVLRLGPLAIAAVAAEPFVDIGLQVKSTLPAQRVLFAGYSNGCVGYIPMPIAYSQGGYEVDVSYLYYHLPGPLAPECAQQVATALLDVCTSL